MLFVFLIAKEFHLVFKEWGTDVEVRADAQGRVEVPAFFGTHRVTSNEHSITVELRKADETATVTLPPQ